MIGAALPPAARAVSLVTNGGFEPDFTGWTVMGGQTFIASQGSIPGYTGLAAIDGTHYAIFSNDAGIYQDLATTIGVTYHFTFYIGNGDDGSGRTSSLTAAFGGQTVFTATNWGGTPFTFEQFNVVATGTVSRVQFSNTGTHPGYLSLDQVVVTAPAPEPATLALFGAGAGIGFLSHRRRKAAARG